MDILLLTDVPPCDNYTAGIVQTQLCRFLLADAHHLDCFCVMDASLTPHVPSDIKSTVSFGWAVKPIEYYGALSYGNIRSLICNNYHNLYTLNHIANSVKAFSKGKRYDLIWCVVQGQSMIKLIRRVSKRIAVPYVVQIWDPPEWWLMEYKFDLFTAQSVMREFAAVLHGARCCLVASWNMAKEYGKMYQANIQTIVPGLPVDADGVDDQRQIRKECMDFRIAFAGQMYAKDEFQQLLYALNYMHWSYQGKNIQLVLYGRSYQNLSGIQDGRVILRGWVDQEKMLSEITEMDLAYCPYWFSDEFRIVSRLSFPSKLTSYLRAGVPVLVHAPEYASISNFVTNGTNGYVCNSLNAEDLQECLISIISDPRRVQIGMNGYQLFKEYLTEDHMKRDFYKALGIR